MEKFTLSILFLGFSVCMPMNGRKRDTRIVLVCDIVHPVPFLTIHLFHL